MLLAHDVTGTGPPLLLINGFALDRRSWDECIPWLAADHQVVRCELRGCGATPQPVAPYRHADDVHALISALGLEPVTIVGLSMGGGVALDVAREYPQSVSRLVLAGSDNPGIPLSRELLHVVLAVVEQALEGEMELARDAWMTSPFVGRASPEVVARIRAMVDDYDGFHWTNHDPHEPGRTTEADLPAITTPTLVIRGDDEIEHLVEKSDLLAARLPHAQSAVIPGAGHVVCMDAPEAFCTEVLAFLRGD